ncbi:MAG: hypothetical protein FWD94_03365 [Treponema sp.]|nr:hypothetical protein [Treponema sp.]
MKKSAMFFAFILVVSSFAFAAEEKWFSSGYQQAFFMGTYVDNGAVIDTYTESRGVNLSSHNFFAGNVGMFTHASFLLQNKGWMHDSNGLSAINFDDYATNFQTGLITGIAFKSNFTNFMKTYFGIGVNYLMTSAFYPGLGNTSYNEMSFNIGMGVDAGFKADLTDRFFVKLGSTFTFDLARYTSLDVYTGMKRIDSFSGWERDFLMLGASPYLSVGINLF